MAETCPNLNAEVIAEVIEVLKGHPYYTSLAISHFALNSEISYDIKTFYYYLRNVLIPQEEAYLRVTTFKN